MNVQRVKCVAVAMSLCAAILPSTIFAADMSIGAGFLGRNHQFMTDAAQTGPGAAMQPETSTPSGENVMKQPEGSGTPEIDRGYMDAHRRFVLHYQMIRDLSRPVFPRR